MAGIMGERGQDASLTRPEAIRAMMETILHILSKDTDEKPTRKAKGKWQGRSEHLGPPSRTNSSERSS